jgi:hypothetical protein
MVAVYDPDVGLLDENYGYPDDGRWNCSMSYASLRSARAPAGYAGIRLGPGPGEVEDFESRVTHCISDYLIGNRTAYLGGYENFHFMSVGASAFRGMSLDLDARGLSGYLQYFGEAYWADVLRGLGHAIEQMITLQYVSYREP